MSLAGQIALVTGASRGIGRGIALQLGQAGATVYITGRKPAESDNKDGTVQELPTLDKTANEITQRGGKGIAVYCDHGNADEIEKLFEQIKFEQDGKLDILVNNAYAAVNFISDNMGKKFWEYTPLGWDTVNNVGLRNHYICMVYASRMMVPRNKGLIVTVSSAGGLQYLFNVAYGVGKAACDRLAADTAVELREYGVTSVSLWPGAVRTELVMKNFINDAPEDDKRFDNLTGGGGKGKLKEMFEQGETTEYSGLIIASLAADINKIDKTGRILLTADLGHEYGLKDIDGRAPPSMRSLSTGLAMSGWHKLASWTPQWLKLPGWMLTVATSKL